MPGGKTEAARNTVMRTRVCAERSSNNRTEISPSLSTPSMARLSLVLLRISRTRAVALADSTRYSGSGPVSVFSIKVSQEPTPVKNIGYMSGELISSHTNPRG